MVGCLRPGLLTEACVGVGGCDCRAYLEARATPGQRLDVTEEMMQEFKAIIRTQAQQQQRRAS